MTGGGVGATTRPLFPRAPRATDRFDRPAGAFVGATVFLAAARGLPLAPFRFFTGADGAAAGDAFRFVGAGAGATGAALRTRFEGAAGAVATALSLFFAAPVPLVTTLEGSRVATRSTAVSTTAAAGAADVVAPPRPAPRPPRRPCSTPRCSSLTRSLICSNMQRT
jgi:hypothetical protein